MIAVMMFAGLLLQEKPIFEDPFSNKLKDGWTWLREDAAGWKLDGGALRIKAQPGKLWYKTKTAKNVLLRKSPASGTPEAPVTFEVTVESAPESASEQCGLYLILDEKNFVKIIREYLKGKTNILLVREQNGIPEPQKVHEESAASVRLRLSWSGPSVSGAYKAAGDWIALGDVPAPAGETPASVALASHGAAPEADRWTRFTEFRITAGTR